MGRPVTIDGGAQGDELPTTAAAPQPGSLSPQHGAFVVGQAEADQLPPEEAQPAGPKGELLARVTAALCTRQQAAPPLPDWLVDVLAAFPDCLLDAVKSGASPVRRCAVLPQWRQAQDIVVLCRPCQSVNVPPCRCQAARAQIDDTFRTGGAVLNLASPTEDGLTPEQLSTLLHETLWCAEQYLYTVRAHHHLKRVAGV